MKIIPRISRAVQLPSIRSVASGRTVTEGLCAIKITERGRMIALLRQALMVPGPHATADLSTSGAVRTLRAASEMATYQKEEGEHDERAKQAQWGAPQATRGCRYFRRPA